MNLQNKNYNRLTTIVLILFFFLILFSTNTFSQTEPLQGVEAQEIPFIKLSPDETRDFPVDRFRNVVIGNQAILDIQALPTNIIRVKAKSSGTTLVYVWDAQGRKTYKFQVESTPIANTFANRPGYNPQGNEFSYHTALTSQFANRTLLAPFWNHDFTASIPIRLKNEWRTLLSATTNSNGISESKSYTPFSADSYLNQMLTYYRTTSSTTALGDISYNPGELSITSFPLRGGSLQLYKNGNKDQLQFFGGYSRPMMRSDYLFSSPTQNLYGVSGSTEIFPDIVIKPSFVYLDQPSTTPIINGQPQNLALSNQTFKNDFVGDLTVQAKPFSDKFNIEGEFGRSSDDNALRALAEYTPYWGRIMMSYKQVGKKYVTPVSFFLLKNYRETNFITDYRVNQKLGFTFNHQLNLFGSDSVLLTEKTMVNRVTVSNVFQKDESTSYTSSGTVIRTQSDSSPQESERLDFSYQKNFKETKKQLSALAFGQRLKSHHVNQSTQKITLGTEARYTKNFSSNLQGTLQSGLQLSKIKSTFLVTSSLLQDSYESVINVGPTLTYTLNKKIFIGGLFENFTFQNLFQEQTHSLQPFASAYFTPNQALSFGTRLNLNIDPTNQFTYLSILAELTYKFGSKVQDTLFSSFQSSGEITGIVFEDSNDDGEYQPTEKLIPGVEFKLNDNPPILSEDGKFSIRAKSGSNEITAELPVNYRNYQFITTNPTLLNIASGETKIIRFGINRHIALQGSVMVREAANSTSAENEKGFEAARIEITGDNHSQITQTSTSGIFNTSVPRPGKYKAKLLVLELPVGYKSIGKTSIEFEVAEGVVTKLPPILLSAKRNIVGRIFLDKNGDGKFDEEETPLGGVKVTVGNSSTTSEADGSFSISNLKAGAYKIEVPQKTQKQYHLNLLTDKLILPEAGTVQLLIPYQP